MTEQPSLFETIQEARKRHGIVPEQPPHLSEENLAASAHNRELNIRQYGDPMGYLHEEEGYEQIGPNLQYNKSCRECYPCLHEVILDGQPRTMSGVEIYKLCLSRGVPVPEHFKEYADE